MMRCQGARRVGWLTVAILAGSLLAAGGRAEGAGAGPGGDPVTGAPARSPASAEQPGTSPSSGTASRDVPPGNLLRNIGGVGGMVLGAAGGSALVSALLKTGGVASLGPLVPRLLAVAVPVLAAYAGAKALSHLGQEADHAIGGRVSGTIIGTSAGALAGFALAPVIGGALAGPAGRLLATGLAGIAGGILGNYFSRPVNWATDAKVLTALAGGALGMRAFGIAGGVGGAALGLLAGIALDHVFFADKNTRLKDLWNGLRGRSARDADAAGSSGAAPPAAAAAPVPIEDLTAPDASGDGATATRVSPTAPTDEATDDPMADLRITED